MTGFIYVNHILLSDCLKFLSTSPPTLGQKNNGLLVNALEYFFSCILLSKNADIINFADDTAKRNFGTFKPNSDSYRAAKFRFL